MFAIIAQKESLFEISKSNRGNSLLNYFVDFLKKTKVTILTDINAEDLVKLEGTLFEPLFENSEAWKTVELNEFQDKLIEDYLFCFGIVNEELRKALSLKGIPGISDKTFHEWKLYDTKNFDRNFEAEEYKGWNEIGPINHPTNSIFLLDFYALNDNWRIQEKGWVSLVKKFVMNNPSKHVDISVMPNEKTIKDAFGKKSNLRPKEIDDVVRAVKSEFEKGIKSECSGKEIKSVIVFADKEKLKEIRIHDRYVVTNCFFIDSRPGFNLFGGKPVETTVSFEFIFYPDVMKKVKKRMIRWKKYIDKLPPVKPSYDATANYFGDKSIGFFSREMLIRT